jgi:cardiolipin synthase (CMP-forming)
VNLPNALSLFRATLVPVLVIFLVQYSAGADRFRPYAIVVFCLAGATDALDGIIARQFHQKTRLGTFLDPFADKLLLVSAFICIAVIARFGTPIPIWAILIMLFRDFLIVSGLLILFLSKSRVIMKPNFVGKMTTFFQMATVLAVLINLPRLEWLWWPSVVFTIISAAMYVRVAFQLFNEQGDSSQTE